MMPVKMKEIAIERGRFQWLLSGFYFFSVLFRNQSLVAGRGGGRGAAHRRERGAAVGQVEAHEAGQVGLGAGLEAVLEHHGRVALAQAARRVGRAARLPTRGPQSTTAGPWRRRR